MNASGVVSQSCVSGASSDSIARFADAQQFVAINTRHQLMAKVIYRLWKDQNADHMILPGSLPLYDGDSRNELVYYLAPGWDAVLEKDIDGERAETTELESKEPRFGAVNAARRVARTIFLGSAPSAGETKQGIRGIDRARILLGCIQPGQTASTFSDALNRLTDRLHYLNSSGTSACGVKM